MTRLRLEILQWTGLLLGAIAVVTAYVFAFGVTEAECNAGRVERWGIENDVWQGAAMGAGCVLILIAQAAAFLALRATRRVSYEDPPAAGRIRFFAITALLANALFLGILVLTGIGATVNATCRQA